MGGECEVRVEQIVYSIWSVGSDVRCRLVRFLLDIEFQCVFTDRVNILYVMVYNSLLGYYLSSSIVYYGCTCNVQLVYWYISYSVTFGEHITTTTTS